MSIRRVNVIGAGGHAKVVVRALLDQDYTINGLFDDDPRRWGSTVLGHLVCGPVERIELQRDCPAVIAIGDNAQRRRMAEDHDLPWATVVHPSALVDPTVEIGTGTVVLHRAVIQPDCRIGKHAIVNTAATVDHDCVLGDCVHLAPGVHLAGGVTVGDGVLLGIGAIVVPGKTVGERAVVGAGAVVVADLAPGVLARGVPARSIPGTAAATRHESLWKVRRAA